MRILFTLALFILLGHSSYAQERATPPDSTRTIDEVTVTVTKSPMNTDMKMTVSVDEYLASSENISFIKRGAYAWEPLLNNLSTERSTITIDGMHVFGACTDKMDPITTYVESNNLQAVDIVSGQEGSMHGSTVAGSIDLKRRATPFGRPKKWSGAYQTGYESNNGQFFNLGQVAFSSDQFVADGSISLRQAGNYSAGNNQEVSHSQFHKFNSSLGMAYKTGALSSLRFDAIYDKAHDVGYPALPMDLWLSRALITSLSYKQMYEKGLLHAWDSKVYFNAVEHYMDDTKRPENLVHMDMPGWSTTYGLVSRIHLQKERHHTELQLNVYDNLSIAEMTMYPQDRSHKTMFAYTWPWVQTRYAGVSGTHAMEVAPNRYINFGGSLGWNYNHAKYPEFNRIFYPEASQRNQRWLPAAHASYQHSLDAFEFSVGTGYGHRAPSVSEGYGYYIYNSFDRYDYIGNPDLPNEISYELNARMGYKAAVFNYQLKANYFHIKNYIVGEILGLGSPMNYQSVGVKGYTSLPYARLFNISLQANYDILEHLHWKGMATYAHATDNQQNYLPFIRPLSYQTSLHYMHGGFGIRVSVNGDLAQENYSPHYGEEQSEAYQVWNISADYAFRLMGYQLQVQLGAENLFDTYYSTYADWGNIPRMGRNIFTSLNFNF